MKNYTNQNLVKINPSDTPSGVLAIKIDNDVFVPLEKITISTPSNQNSGGEMNAEEFFDWMMILDNK